MINSNLTDTREPIARQRREQGIDLPILMDETQIIGESLGLRAQRRSARHQSAGLEAGVSRPARRGSTNYAADALDAVLAAHSR